MSHARHARLNKTKKNHGGTATKDTGKGCHKKMNIDASGMNLTTTPKYEATVSATSVTLQLDGGDMSATRTH